MNRERDNKNLMEQIEWDKKHITPPPSDYSNEAIYWMNQTMDLRKENKRLREALQEINTHLRSTSDPRPHIICTLKKLLGDLV